MSISIPKRIMQTWKNHTIPEKWKTSPESIKKFMPDWEYVLMTDEDNRELIVTHFPHFISYYDNFPYNIQRADAVRYAYLYLFGGIYIDMDNELLQPLDSLFTTGSDLYLVASSNIGSCITNSLMASVARHPIWLECMEEMKKPLPSWSIGKHWKVMKSTGPMMLDKVVKTNNHQYTVLPNSLVLPCSICDISCNISNSFIKPLQGASWVGFDTLIYNFIMCKYKAIITVIVLVFILLIAIIIKLLMDKKKAKNI